jgi:hypothetical protein
MAREPMIADRLRRPSPYGVYVHIPFCASKCDYCAFATWTDRHHLATAYLDALVVDIGRAVAPGCRRRRASSSVVARRRWCPRPTWRACSRRSRCAPAPRSPSSATPTTSRSTLFRAYVDAGVGPRQPRRAVDGVARARVARPAARPPQRRAGRRRGRAAGLPTFNLDLIYGAAGESLDDWEPPSRRWWRSIRRTCRRTRSRSRPAHRSPPSPTGTPTTTTRPTSTSWSTTC